MPTYTILAKRETLYEFQIEADSENEALEEMERIESAEDVEEYAYQWFPLQVTETEVSE
jgi:hypothetical protein